MVSDWVVGVDLGGTKIALGLIDPEDRIVTRRRVLTDAHEGPQAVVERIAQGVAELASELPGRKRISALGICCPGEHIGEAHHLPERTVSHIGGNVYNQPLLLQGTKPIA